MDLPDTPTISKNIERINIDANKYINTTRKSKFDMYIKYPYVYAIPIIPIFILVLVYKPNIIYNVNDKDKKISFNKFILLCTFMVALVDIIIYILIRHN